MEVSYTNSAYVAALEILFLNKIYKLRKDLLHSDFEEIENIVFEFGLAKDAYIESNYILFKTNSTRLNELIKLLKFSLKVKEILKISKHIFEFNILIFKANLEEKSIARQVRKRLLTIPTDKQIWLFQENNPIINYSVQVSHVRKGLLKVIAVNEKYSSKNFLEKCLTNTLLHPNLAKTLNKVITDGNTQTIGIVGKNHTGKTIFLQMLCDSNTHKFIYLSAYSQFQEASYPFIMLLFHLSRYFIQHFRKEQRERLEYLCRQVELDNILSYKQVEIDICALLQHLAKEAEVVLVCDNIDNWPIESLKLLQIMNSNLYESGQKIKIVCSMIGIYYPIGSDEIIHFPNYLYKDILKEQLNELSILEIFSKDLPELSAKERLLAILPCQRIKIFTKSLDFCTLIKSGLQDQELTVLAIVERYPYIFTRNLLVEIFQDSQVSEIVDCLLDFYFLREVEDHLGSHLFCSLDCELQSLGLKIPQSITKNIQNYFQRHIVLNQSNIFSLYVLSQNGIYLYEAIEQQLYSMLERGYATTVNSFIKSGTLEEYQPAIHLWNILYQKNRLELKEVQEYFDSYEINISNIRFFLPLSNYYYNISDYDKSLKINKEAIYLFNNNEKYKIYITNIFQIQAKIFISKCMFKEAIEYLNIALESLQDTNKIKILYQIIYLKLLCLFFEKELHLAIVLINKYSFEEYFNLYGEVENYFEMKLLVVRIYFEIGQYDIARSILEKLLDLSLYYCLDNYHASILCWIARMFFYAGEFQQGGEHLRNVLDCEEKLYFQGERFYLCGEKEKALHSAMQALKISLKSAIERKNIGLQTFDNIYSLQEGKLLACRGKTDPLLLCIEGFTSYLHTFYGSYEIAEKILHRIIHRPSSEFSPFQHIFYYFYYLFLSHYSESQDHEDMLYLSYAISILQNDSSKILNTEIRHNYIYNNHWNNLIRLEGEKYNLLVSGGSRSHAPAASPDWEQK